MAEAFPDYDQAARNGDRFRRLLTGLDPALQAKCYEQGATDMEEALTMACHCERARQAMRTSALGLSYASLHPAVVATLNSSPTGAVDCNATATEKLIHTVERLTSRMDRRPVTSLLASLRANQTMGDHEGHRSQRNVSRGVE